MLAVLLVLAAPSYAADSTYVPFVTDFPRGAPSATDDGYVPFVTDFPRGAQNEEAVSRTAGGFDWEAAGAIGVVVGALAMLALLLLARRSRRIEVASR
jgi:hypothetical protein